MQRSEQVFPGGRSGRRWLFAGLAVSLLLSGCGLTALSTRAPTPVFHADCAPVAGAEALWARPGLRYLLVGEAHGTVEVPDLFADLVCAAARRGPVVVGVEHPPQEAQAALDAYLHSDGGLAARAALTAPPVWRDSSGRTSRAMLAMIERVRRMRQAGAEVSLLAFDPVRVPSGASAAREAAMAEALRVAAARAPGALVIALTGSGHADKEGFTSFQPPFPSPAQLLPAGQTVSLALARTGGEAWLCRAPDPPGTPPCRIHALTVRDAVRPRGLTLDPALRAGFDGVLSTGGAYTASPPAVPVTPG